MIIDQIYGKKNVLMIVVVVIATIAIYQFLIPVVYSHIPNDFSRTKIVLNVLDKKNTNYNPSTVILGNSIVMNCVNTKLLAQKINLDTNSVYNLSTTGQNFNESVLFYPLIKNKATVKHIIQFIYLSNFICQDSIEDSRVDNLLMYGYKKNDESKYLLQNFYSNEFNQSKFIINWKSRKIISGFINNEFRNILRKDLNIKSKESLYFPSVYTKRVPDEAYQKLIQKFNPTHPITVYQEDSSIINLIKRASSFCKKNNIEFTLVFSPVNPALNAYTDTLKQQIMNRFNQPDLNQIKVINCMNLVSEPDFIDHVHPNPKVAKSIADEISTKFKSKH
ncbi:MAG: hypothetical protein RIQ33_250 [Bacteroidota bacterium]